MIMHSKDLSLNFKLVKNIGYCHIYLYIYFFIHHVYLYNLIENFDNTFENIFIIIINAAGTDNNKD